MRQQIFILRHNNNIQSVFLLDFQFSETHVNFLHIFSSWKKEGLLMWNEFGLIEVR